MMATFPLKHRPSSEGSGDLRGGALPDFCDFGFGNSHADLDRVQFDDREDRHSGGDRLAGVDSCACDMFPEIGARSRVSFSRFRSSLAWASAACACAAAVA